MVYVFEIQENCVKCIFGCVLQIVELKMVLEYEKVQMLKDFYIQKEIVIFEYEKEMDNFKEIYQNELYEFKCRIQEK